MQKHNVDNFNFLSPKNESRNIKLGLKRIKDALNKINNPCIKTPAIQIIGTNGKGSITAFLENILYLNNIYIGVTTSPHLFDICERIRTNQKYIPKRELNLLFEELGKLLKDCDLTPFEFIICCALKFFDKKKVDLIILEAGLGGRLDATSAHKLRPIIAIGKIGLDHSDYLGDTIEKITQEKIAVIQQDSFVISCKQDDKVEGLINNRIKKVNANMIWVDAISEEWSLGLEGSFQRENAAVALGVIKVLNQLGWKIDNSSIRKGLEITEWPGRLQLLKWKNNKILIDSAHNPSAAAVLSKERENWENQEKGVYWIMGVQKQKDCISIIRKLFNPLDKILLVPVPNQKSWTLDEISKSTDLYNGNIFEFDHFKLALNYLEQNRGWPACHPVLTGSIYLVSEFLKSTQAFNL
ncbi:MAG: bifunctional folylpolyglutamate synthase/ dihydrofolate synthase [Prochlorococcus sp. SP3034]|nr:bifunctional folylpolyglutamate synthase/ dihydrofolate synthase [Prochlorococcus sp. SP3034]